MESRLVHALFDFPGPVLKVIVLDVLFLLRVHGVKYPRRELLVQLLLRQLLLIRGLHLDDGRHHVIIFLVGHLGIFL